MMTYKDIYKFPLRVTKYGDWVYDSEHNFVFQFEIDGKDSIEIIMKTLNGEKQIDERERFYHEKGEIKSKESNQTYITIRGWDNLTGIGAHNLSGEDASNIQDTFAEFVVNKLNGK